MNSIDFLEQETTDVMRKANADLEAKIDALQKSKDDVEAG